MGVGAHFAYGPCLICEPWIEVLSSISSHLRPHHLSPSGRWEGCGGVEGERVSEMGKDGPLSQWPGAIIENQMKQYKFAQTKSLFKLYERFRTNCI